MAKNDNIPSVLAFEKKLVPSDGYLYGTTWENRVNSQAEPLKLQEKSVRGTISNRLKPAIKNDPAKLNSEVEKANLQTVDTCSLTSAQDTLKFNFTLKVLGGVEQPSACNNATFKQNYALAAQAYIDEYQFIEIARRYAINIANARYLWRNRVGAEAIEVHVKGLNKDVKKEWVFDAMGIQTHHFDADSPDINDLAHKIASALSSKNGSLILEITVFAKVGKAQEVYPSQELVLDKGKGNKSKILYAVNNIAGMHSQKIGNAIRTIDTWYPSFGDQEFSAGPIAIEPYGSVTNLGKAYRTPKDKQDFYSFFDRFALGEKLERAEDKHYVMATLIRGGVFGKSEK